MQQPQSLTTEIDEQRAPLVLSFHDIDASMLAQVGGKAANLGEMTRAGLPVPPGFCLSTTAYAQATRVAALEPLLDQIATTPATTSAQLAAYAARVREKLLAIELPDTIVAEVTRAYEQLAPGQPVSVAVRSSATAEDLPFASFAGQQDTYLNIVGLDALLDAIRRCWSSLWTDRAVSYRASNRIDPRAVRLAVVVQQMVESSLAGVLFTANPLTGQRCQAVIDASPGLGEAVVSGAVNPDHFVVNTSSGEILERRLGDKRVVIRATPGGGTQRVELPAQSAVACIADEQIRALVNLGARVESHYGAPQDIEWAFDASGKLWLTQARPITTLFPLPANVPADDEDLRVYLSVSVIQGVYRPLTPMGVQAFRLISSAGTAFALGRLPRDPVAGQPFVVESGQRLFLDTTEILRNPLGRDVIIRLLGGMEAQSGRIFQKLIADPRLTLRTTSRWSTVRRIIPIALRTGIPLKFVRTLLRPQAARQRIADLETYLRQPSTLSAGASAADYLDEFERRILQGIPRIARTVMPAAFAGIASAVLAPRMLRKIATPDEVQTVLRSLPHNPTTEMDLALWSLTQRLQADPALAEQIKNTPAEQLAQAYRQGELPTLLQQELAEFLRSYGHRAVAEIDLGVARWSEDPTHILGVLANYLRIIEPEMAPDVQFERGAWAAEAMVAELTQRAGRKGWFYGKRARFILRRIRELTGIREVPKFCFILLFMGCRELLWSAGNEMVRAGYLERAEDIFFLTLPEARAALVSSDQRSLVRARRASYEHELERRHLPRVLLSDGTEPGFEGQRAEEGADTLTGTPASAGSITGKARVILEPTGAHLEPGEILVAPSTDPGWTPLFLSAGGLVMEMGGAVSHGAVVAREYGIPAVVGVHGATERITTGQHITVDGSRGTVVIGTKED